MKENQRPNALGFLKVLLQNNRQKYAAILIALMLLSVFSSSTMAQTLVTPASFSGSTCWVYSAVSGQAAVRSAPSFAAPIINHLYLQDLFHADGYVMSGGEVWYRIMKHAPGNEFTIGVGYVHASSVVVPQRCSEAPPLFRPADNFFNGN